MIPEIEKTIKSDFFLSEISEFILEGCSRAIIEVLAKTHKQFSIKDLPRGELALKNLKTVDGFPNTEVKNYEVTVAY